MPLILSKLPIYDRTTTVEVRGRRYQILPYQILVWVSLSPKALRDLDPRTPRFPAVLDPAFTDNFLIHRHQVLDWAGWQPEHFPQLNAVRRPPGRRIPLHAANLWIHRNLAGERDQLAATVPILLELDRGIGICADADGYPRLPLLGARALGDAQLYLGIDYRRRQVSLRTPRRFWFFG